MDLFTTKIVVAILCGVIRFFIGMLPVKIYHILKTWEGDDGSQHFINPKRHTQVNCAIALCQSFGGGVLFATCFLHMMLEIHNSVEDLKKLGHLNTEYPLSQLTISFGFFMIYFLEEISHWIITKLPPEHFPPIKPKFNNFTSASVTPLELTVNNIAFIEEKSKRGEEVEDISTNSRREMHSAKTVLSIDEKHENIVYDTLSLNSDVGTTTTRSRLEQEVEEQQIEDEIHYQQQIMRCVLVDFALCLHSIFEGLTIGLQSKINNIWYLFIAVSVHSATILFCMGLELLLAKAKTKVIVLQMFALSIASPFGIILGILFTIKSNVETRAKSTAIVLLEGLSAGTVMYITFFEVLNREKERRVYRIQRAFCIITGFCMMAVLQYVEIDRHVQDDDINNT